MADQPDEDPIASITDVIRRGETTYLELRVNIEGQDRRLLLEEDATARLGWTYPAAVAELNLIRQLLTMLKEDQNSNSRALVQLGELIVGRRGTG